MSFNAKSLWHTNEPINNNYVNVFTDDYWRNFYDSWVTISDPINFKFNEKENKEMPKKSLVERLYEERDELEAKLVKLKEFISSEAFDYLSLEDRDLLRAQENAMVTYHSILNIRIKHIKKEY